MDVVLGRGAEELVVDGVTAMLIDMIVARRRTLVLGTGYGEGSRSEMEAEVDRSIRN